MLPTDVRPKAFAAVELFLDLTHVARSLVAADLETMLIWFSITEATLRPLMLDQTVPAQKKLAKKPPTEDLGTISRLMIADRTGLPRETVRRKVNALIEAGLAAEVRVGRIRTVLDITAPHVMTAIDESSKAVSRYQKRLHDLGAL